MWQFFKKSEAVDTCKGNEDSVMQILSMMSGHEGHTEAARNQRKQSAQNLGQVLRMMHMQLEWGVSLFK